MPKSELVEIEGELKGETEKAYRFSDGIRNGWLPKSMVEWHPDDKIMVMPVDLAIEKGFV